MHTQKSFHRYVARATSTRSGYASIRLRLALLLLGLAAASGTTLISRADGTAGLDSRATIGAYNDGLLPTATSQAMPATLSAAGVFTDLASRTPKAGYIPYVLNSPLWTDGADKSRYIGVPFDSTQPNDPVLSPKIGFSPTGNWTFPNGTVIIKNFDMKVDERPGAIDPIRRLETRLLIRNADGTIRGATYRWGLPTGGVYTDDPTIVNAREDVTLNIIQADGSTRQQLYTFPGPDDCTTCHNAKAGMVLGLRTAQLNGDLTYAATGRTANQLHTLNQLNMFNVAIADPSTYDEAVDVNDTTATYEHRVRSYLASNCSHCHMPQNIGPIYDMRFETPSETTNIFGAPFNGLVRGNPSISRLYVRDSALPGNQPMPPIARNVPDQRVLSLYSEWMNYGYNVTSATRLSETQVKLVFNRPLEAPSAMLATNYKLDNDATVTQAVADTDPAAVILTTSPLAVSTTYTVTINRVRELQAPQNPIWPNTTVSFTTPGPSVPGAPTLTLAAAGNASAQLSFTAPASNGGATITSYNASCVGPTTVTASGWASPLNVTGLTNGSTYSCSVKAENSAGQGAASNALDVTPVAPVPVLTGVVSRKVHGTAGTFDLPLNRRAAMGGDVTVEPRIAGGAGSGHQIVFQFDIPITSSGTAATTTGSAIATVSGNEVIVTLDNIGNGERTTVSLTGVSGVGLNVSVSLGFLAGDVNSSRGVTQMDISAIKARTGQVADSSNFFYDINASGSITAADVSAIKARMNAILP
ncbi:MAG: fibronectin type III domain-containing protein [Betaproteobacteria bacterium]|nr:fibronectin type III domain-containing protein [Betaproteobacteria bacterium]